MQDYSISKSTRRCAISGRNLEPDESYFSVILPEGEEVTRVDIAASNWKGPTEGAIGWWRNKMPSAAARARRPASNAQLLETLSSLLECPGKEELAYLLALLLVRRRVLQEEQSLFRNDDGEPSLSSSKDRAAEISNELQADDAVERFWKLQCPVDGREWNVLVAIPSPETTEALQSELHSLLTIDE